MNDAIQHPAKLKVDPKRAAQLAAARLYQLAIELHHAVCMGRDKTTGPNAIKCSCNWCGEKAAFGRHDWNGTDHVTWLERAHRLDEHAKRNGMDAFMLVTGAAEVRKIIGDV